MEYDIRKLTDYLWELPKRGSHYHWNQNVR